MKNVHHPHGKRLLAMLIPMIATGTMLAAHSVQAKSPPNIVTDINWSAGYNSVTDIMSAFNNARRGEEMQLGLAANTLGNLVLPSQSTWDGMTNDAKALFLINAERTARANMQTGVIGLPLAGIESHVDTVAQNYADLLVNGNKWGHYEPSGDSNIDNPGKRIDSGVGAACKEFTTRSENLAAFRSMSNSSPQNASNIKLPVEQAVYNWIYDDASSSWGHREAVLLQDSPLSNPTATTWGFKNNHGSSAHEGFLGLHVAGSTSYAIGQPQTYTYNYGVVVVMNIFDQVSDANAANCGYNVTLRTEDLPSTGGGNQAPTASPDSATTNVETDVEIAVLENDSDPDDDTLTITDHTDPSHGSVTLNGDVFTYSPAEGFSGSDSFTYTIDDGNGHTTTATVTITVNPDPTLIVDAVDDSFTTLFGKAVEFNVLTNDFNPPNSGAISIKSNTKPDTTTGALTLVKSGGKAGNAKFTPKKGFSGQVSFTYTVTNNAKQTDTASVTITVKPNQPPRATGGSTMLGYEVGINRPRLIEYGLTGSDTEDGTIAKPHKINQPSNGKVTKKGSKYYYTPNNGFVGQDSFSYTVIDKEGVESTPGTVRLRVTATPSS